MQHDLQQTKEKRRQREKSLKYKMQVSAQMVGSAKQKQINQAVYTKCKS